MKVLVIGGGGREHALVWKLSQDRARPSIFCAPGNAGTAPYATNLPLPAEEVEGLLAWAKRERPDLTVVGPEAPLCAGVVDLFMKEGLRVFGPSQAAAQMEGSKVFAKEVMTAAGVPTAQSRFFSEAFPAKMYVRSLGVPLVIKAEGLAAGKGVTVCSRIEDAERAIDECLVDHIFGAAGTRVLVEEFLEGEEVSILALVDGTRSVMLASAQDHKRVFDGDQGPNTGGMGAYSPAPVVTDEWWPVIQADVFDRTLAELQRRGICYRGVLYAGLMMTTTGPKVLEFNCRFGDPETQVILPRLESDLIPALEACIDGTLTRDLLRWRSEACVCVVAAAGGYPGSYQKGNVISGLREASQIPASVVFHAGTQCRDEQVITAGGRVLGITAWGHDLPTAVDSVYRVVDTVGFEGMHVRRDIAGRALSRLVKQ